MIVGGGWSSQRESSREPEPGVNSLPNCWKRWKRSVMAIHITDSGASASTEPEATVGVGVNSNPSLNVHTEEVTDIVNQQQ